MAGANSSSRIGGQTSRSVSRYVLSETVRKFLFMLDSNMLYIH